MNFDIYKDFQERHLYKNNIEVKEISDINTCVALKYNNRKIIAIDPAFDMFQKYWAVWHEFEHFKTNTFYAGDNPYKHRMNERIANDQMIIDTGLYCAYLDYKKNKKSDEEFMKNYNITNELLSYLKQFILRLELQKWKI